MSRTTFSSVVVAGLIAMMTPAPTGAMYTYDKLAYMTFSGPVQVPGAMLDAGTYRFRLANPESSRNVLQVLSNDGSTVHAMFFTLPDRRIELTDSPTVTFRETPAGVPPAVRSLFYGGEHRGYEFVYPKGGPIMTATVPSQPEITYEPIAAAIPEAIAEPVAAAVPEPAAIAEPAVAEAAPSPEPAPAAEPAELPRTASPLPFAATGGFGMLIAGLGVGLLRRRLN
jgi:hypothetical protein